MSADTPHPEMSFADHLTELRSRLVKSVIAVALATAACYTIWDKLLAFFTDYPLRGLEHPPNLIYTAPAEAFMLSFKIAIFGGITLAVPVVLYQVWCFISPGLHLKERKTIFPVVIFSTLFFLGGVAFCYFTVLPLAFQFLLNFYVNRLVPMLSISTYIGFIIKLLLAFGLVFEMPVFTFILVKLGILTHTFLIRQARYAVIIIFIIAAILTPPDVLSQTLMAVPMLLLYVLSIGVAFFARRQNA